MERRQMDYLFVLLLGIFKKDDSQSTRQKEGFEGIRGLNRFYNI